MNSYPLERVKCLCGPVEFNPPKPIFVGVAMACANCGAQWAISAVRSHGHEGKPEVFMDLVSAPPR